MLNFNEAVEFLRERLFQAFSYGCHLTAKKITTPIIETPPKPPSEEDMWALIKNQLLEGRDLTHNQDGTPNSNKRETMATLLENARKEMRLSPYSSGSNASSNVATLNKIIFPVIRRVFPTLIANEIIGVQAMTGPVAQIHTLRVRYNDPPKVNVTPLLNESSLSLLSKVENNDELEGKIRELAVKLEELIQEANAKLENLPVLEGTGGNRLSIQVLKEVVEAKTRKLAARWTFEAAKDIQITNPDCDIEAEIMAALAQEITAEIDQEILSFLRKTPGEPTSTFDMMMNVTGTPTFIGDVHAALAILINRQANLIAARTRRGAGNWCIVSPTGLTILQSATTSAFARTTESVFEAPTNTKFVGTLNNAMRVYVDQYAADNTPVLVGYKGNEIDAAAYYCPYSLLSSSGTIIDPQTFEPVVSFMTRYGFLALQNSSSSLGNAADYLGLIGIDTGNLTFI